MALQTTGRVPARLGFWTALGLVLAVVRPAGADPTHGRPGMLDITGAVVVTAPDLSGPERKTVGMLVDEVEKRTSVRWALAEGAPREGPAIFVGSAESLARIAPRHLSRPDAGAGRQRPEGYRIRADKSGPTVVVAGNDDRGVLFGVGRLLRELRMSQGRVLVTEGFAVESSPRLALRGHQLGYRPKTNSYDGWDLPQWEQYIRDLAVFGTNAVELVPPRTDDDADSPHFPRPPLEMMVGMSRLLGEYGLDVWVWYPAMAKDYAMPETVESELKEWGAVFEKLPRLDAVFVPGGDPGHTRPTVLMAFLEKVAAVLRRHHPKAGLWVSPQGFNREWLDEFLGVLRTEPAWLTGVVYGPQIRVGPAELRAAVPSRYPLRLYPDITHSLQCQYPVPDWDLAFALTEGREVINPRPTGQAAISRATHELSAGFLTYSEGCNDDVNKTIWSGLGWDQGADVVELLRQYARYFIGSRLEEGFAQGLLALERNWQGPLATNRSVETTLSQFQDMERTASPRERLNWRFQQALYRAYFDAYVRDRLLNETALEAEAHRELRRAAEVGSLTAMRRAQDVLDRAVISPVSRDRKARVEALAEALFQSIRMQLSVPRYGAIAVGRGANLDMIDVPLNDRRWLTRRFDALRTLADEDERREEIGAILRRTDPGPGGFYDNFGDPTRQPHLIRGPEFERDPAFLRSALVGFGQRPEWPMAWRRNAQSLNDAPLKAHYEGLDHTARYRVRVVYTGDTFNTRMRLEADGQEVHPLIKKPLPVRPMEFEVPAGATEDGEVTLTWTQEAGRGGNGRGCQVSEVWLVRATSN
jgi:hypothetical protein